MTQDSTLNNLALPAGTPTLPPDSPARYTKSGSGPIPLILIAGLGFGGGVFSEFGRSHATEYTVYTVTLPGFGGIPPFPLPPDGTSFGTQTWLNLVANQVSKLIEQERLTRPIVAGHFVAGTQAAFITATKYRRLVAGVVSIGGPAKFVPAPPRKAPASLAGRIKFVDSLLAPKWYKTVTRRTWTENMYDPEVYSLDTVIGRRAWREADSASIPVMVEYLCEYFASDLSTRYDSVQMPALVFTPGFSAAILGDTANPFRSYLKPQFIDSWIGAAESNPLFRIVHVPNSGVDVWIDQPEFFARELAGFAKRCRAGLK